MVRQQQAGPQLQPACLVAMVFEVSEVSEVTGAAARCSGFMARMEALANLPSISAASVSTSPQAVFDPTSERARR